MSNWWGNGIPFPFFGVPPPFPPIMGKHHHHPIIPPFPPQIIEIVVDKNITREVTIYGNKYTIRGTKEAIAAVEKIAHDHQTQQVNPPPAPQVVQPPQPPPAPQNAPGAVQNQPVQPVVAP